MGAAGKHRRGQVHRAAGTHEAQVGTEVGDRCACAAGVHLGRCAEGPHERTGGGQVLTEGR